MNSKVKTLNLRAAGSTLSLLAALSLSLTGPASLAQSKTASAAAPAYQTRTTPTTTTTTTETKTATGAAPAGGQATVVPKTSDLVALQGPTLITQKAAGWKTASTFIELKDGQQTLPLTFTVTNGANGQAKMQGIRINLNGREILNEKAFKGKDSVSLNLSNLVNAGQSQLIINSFGPTGATLSWVLTTLKIKVSDIKPVNCAIGDKVTISGKNFPTDKSAYRLTVDTTSATITKATATSLEFQVPTGLAGGKRTVTLWIAGVKCDPLYIKISAAPEVTGVNLYGAAPGGPIIISGKGFSATASDNQVLFKTPDGQLVQTASPTAATETELTVIIPMDYPCPSDILATVKTKGQESAKGVTFACSQRVIDKNVFTP
ncbi:MAG: IPT/TIG domain-containing protein [Cyanobacteria bacterium SZAS LIN-3]|nr:IPT/TIG domain-containing protein [Cyanobacteria bacterium SZAS LIN-3]MBS2010716.1 IPT/TIG domain-containing protein [Cyanobacteria bacterium SZAS TMP-1]